MSTISIIFHCVDFPTFLAEIMETYEAAEKHLDNGDLQLCIRPENLLNCCSQHVDVFMELWQHCAFLSDVQNGIKHQQSRFRGSVNGLS